MDKGDFAAQLSRLRPVMYTFSRRFVAGREEGWDLVQDTILKALRCKSQYRDDVNLKGWLFTIMRNTFINQYRRDSRFRKVSDEKSQVRYLNTVDASSTSRPDGYVNFLEASRIVEECREELSTPFKLYTSGFKYYEIAAQLRLPLGTVKNRIFQARQEIQKKLTHY